MVQQLSTSVSDAVLAAVSYYAASSVVHTSITGALGFILIAVTATFGGARFGSHSPSDNLVYCHDGTSWLATVLGMPCLAAGFYHRTWPFAANLHLASGILFVMFGEHIITTGTRTTLTDVAGGSALVSILLGSSTTMQLDGIIGAVGYVMASLLVGTTNDRLFGAPRVDIYHYTLAAANVCLMLAINH